ncbi:amino acid ABC transporter substrate-binding protein [Paucibacter aquatile]|uniref:Amino acid ABC transporter substrate-binding protein n=2 Tax=Kinneretia aquatilis TaxID=2070761 RepID=A0A2N8KS00_9BURK|nr:amino acid ABC transporter substrate-binding protein [Paucibacter aquatile]
MRSLMWIPGRSTLAATRLGCVALFTLLAAGMAPAQAGDVLKRVQREQQLKVCIWPGYYGVTFRSPRTGELQGIDIDLSAALAQDLGVKLQHVESSFPKLIEDLSHDRCDVAMFAIGVTAERQQQLRFSSPYLQSDIYGITTRSSRSIRAWSDIDKPGIKVAVQAGTFMEPVVSAWLKQAQVVVIRPPQTREQELEAGRVDIFMTDYPYSRRLLDNADWARLVSSPTPFSVLPYAYAVKPGDEEWLGRLNTFVAAIKKDGRLVAAAKKHGLSEILLPR